MGHSNDVSWTRRETAGLLEQPEVIIDINEDWDWEYEARDI